MRNLDGFDAVFVDLDDTLIHGFMTNLMDYTWKKFKNQNIATFLATIQSKFKLYKVNKKLLYMLNNCNKPIYILTARKPLKATFNLVQDILPKAILIEMSSQCPYVDKVEYIRDKDYEHTILFDDNKWTRLNANLQDILAIDPTPMFEEVIE